MDRWKCFHLFGGYCARTEIFCGVNVCMPICTTNKNVAYWFIVSCSLVTPLPHASMLRVQSDYVKCSPTKDTPRRMTIFLWRFAFFSISYWLFFYCPWNCIRCNIRQLSAWKVEGKPWNITRISLGQLLKRSDSESSIKVYISLKRGKYEKPLIGIRLKYINIRTTSLHVEYSRIEEISSWKWPALMAAAYQPKVP